MILVDVVIILIIVAYAYFGWRRGFIHGLFDLIGLVVALFAALFLYRYVAVIFEAIGFRSIMANLLALIIVFLILISIFWLLVQRVLRRVSRSVVRSPVNRAFGVLIGVIKGIFVVSVVALALVSLPLDINKAAITESAIGGRLLEVGSWIERLIVSTVPEEAIDGLTFRTIPPEGRQQIDIPAATNIRVNPELEQRMLALVNRERTAVGLPPLVMDQQLREVAREHSRDMFNRGYFSHNNPDGEDAFHSRARYVI